MQSRTRTSPSSRVVDIAVLCGFVLLCLAVGYFGSRATAPNLEPWYAELAKPSWTPPPVLFPIVWTILYLEMAVAAWLVWRTKGKTAPKYRALLAFFVQLALNGGWSWAFFAAQSPGLGLVVIIALLVAIVWTTGEFFRTSWIAGTLMLPYFAWVAFASALNIAIFMMNA